MTHDFNLIVVGTGSAGTAIAMQCRKAGWHVAIVDERPFGGTCQLRGCDPKKVLTGVGDLVDWARRMQVAGTVYAPLRIDWPGLMRFKRTFTDPAPAAREKLYADAGIATFHGTARFEDENTLRINDDTLRARHIAIASGAMPVPLHIPGEELLTTSDVFLELRDLPSPIVFVGGGFISFEFGHLAARAGAQVHIVEAAPRPLGGFDSDLVHMLAQATREIGIALHLGTTAKALERHGDEIVLHAECDGKPLQIACSLVVHGGGRAANLDGLDLAAANVERTKKGVKVNQYLQSTTNPAVFAAGDAADGGAPQLTPVAAHEGEIAAENLLNGNRRSADFAGLVSNVYTTPALASAGLSEAQAREKSQAFKVHAGDTSNWYSSLRVAARASAYKILVDQSEEFVLGAHFLGPHAEELANIFSLAIRAKVPVSTLKDTLFGYPTAASDIEYMLS